MIYFYDGSKTAFLTAFVLAFRDGQAVLSSRGCQLSLAQETVFVTPEPERAKKAEQRLLKIDPDCMNDLSTLLRSGDQDRDMVALNYFKLLVKEGRPVRKMFAEECVTAAMECIRRVTFEIHRFHGFVRFMESASGALYAPISPDNDICDLLVPHFRARLPEYPFVIHDVGRKKAAVYDGSHVFLAPLERAEVLLSSDEKAWQALWKNYYDSVNIPSRERLRQMRGYMPVRYWKFMPERSRPTL